jgi:hypothetical protein
MFLAHYLLILGIFLVFKSKIAFWGLLLGNFIDLDHFYPRLFGKIGWAESACTTLGEACRFGFYPLHNWFFLILFLALSGFVFSKDKKIKFCGFVALGAFLNILLDIFQMSTGIGFSILN